MQNCNSQKIVAKSLALPKGGGAISGIGEKTNIQDFTGSAAFSIPLNLSPCRQIENNLSLIYSSASGNSSFGLGWNLNIAKISRKTSKGIPRYDEGDSFLLNDSQDLVPLNQPPYPSSVGTTNYNITAYQLRNEGSFSLIEYWQEDSANKLTNAFWKITDSRNNISIFGKNNQAKIINPANANQTFSWLIEEICTAIGDHQIFLYKAEDKVNVANNIYENNRNVFCNRYLERIRYGNITQVAGPMVLADDPAIEDYAKWHFEMVFNYGEYDVSLSNLNPYQPTKTWLARLDAFSTYNAGFEIRNYRQCFSALMFHNFSELGSQPVLVDLLQLTYVNNSVSISELASATKIAYQYNFTANTCQSAPLPAVEYSYSQFAPQSSSFNEITNIDNGNLPSFGESADYSFVDLYGEGIAGVLCNSASGSYYSRAELSNVMGYNAGNQIAALYSGPLTNDLQKNISVKYQDWELLKSFPIDGSLAKKDLVLLDIDGSGNLDLVSFKQGLKGYWQAGSAWEDFRNFNNFPIDFSAADQNLVNMNGTGFNDLVQLRDGAVRVYPALGQDGWDISSIVKQQNFPVSLTSSKIKSLHFLDMDGSGRPHLVLVENGRITYWPNLGYGNFGEKIVMENSPQFDADFDVSRLFIADLDGSGTGDVIYFNSNSALVFSNCNGNSFNDPITINLPIIFDDISQISFADITGRGTSSLIISDPKNSDKIRHWYYDFCQGQKPYLLNEVDNNVGATVELVYGSSVDFYLVDKKTGLNWVTPLPFVAHVVIQVTTNDQISNSSYASQYAYHHGYYDGIEQEFRGFGRVDSQDIQIFSNLPDSLYSFPSLSRAWFHLGSQALSQKMLVQYKSEYFSADSAAFNSPTDIFDFKPADGDGETQRLAYITFAGLKIRSEIYGLDGNSSNPYSVTESAYYTKFLQSKGENLYAIFLTYKAQDLSYCYERDAADPRISQSFILETDQYGNVALACDVYYPRRNVAGAYPDQQKFRITCSTADYAYKIDAEDYLIGVPTLNQSFEITGFANPTNGAFVAGELSEAIAAAFNHIISIEFQASQINPSIEQAWLFSSEEKRYTQLLSGVSAVLPYGQIASPILLAQVKTIEFSQALINQVFSPIITSDQIAANLAAGLFEPENEYWLNPGLIMNYFDSDNFYLPQGVEDPLQNATSYQYDDYNLFLIKTTDPLGNVIRVANMDYRVLKASAMIDINGNNSQVAFDCLGQVIYTTFFGEERGAAVGFAPINQIPQNAAQSIEDVITNAAEYLGQMQSFYYYDYFAWQDRQEPTQTITLTTENYPQNQPATPVFYFDINYANGFGRILQAKKNVESGPAFQYDTTTKQVVPIANSTNRWLTSGFVVYDNKGNEVQKYDPYFFDSEIYIGAEILLDNQNKNNFGYSSTTFYDPLNRVVEVLTEKGFLLKKNWNAWQLEEYDANDTIRDSLYYQDNVVNPNPTPALPYYDPDYPSLRSNIAYVAEYFYNTPYIKVFNNLGQIIIEQQMNNSAQFGEKDLFTNHTYATNGWLLSTIDPRLAVNNYEFIYGLGGQNLQLNSVDSGSKWMLKNIFGNAIFSCDARKTLLTNSYDKLQRLVSTNAYNSAAADPLALNQIVEFFIYGDTLSPDQKPQQHNLCGRVYQHYDQAGLTTFPDYGILGGVLGSSRQFTIDYKNAPNWNVPINAALLQSETTYVSSFSYDAFARVTQEVESRISANEQVVNNSTNYQYALCGKINSISSSSSDNGNQSTTYINSTSYNANGQRLQICYANNTTTTYSYDLRDWSLTNITSVNTQNNNVLQNLFYLYDPQKNIIQKNDQSQDEVFYNNQQVLPACQYVYDALYRLISGQGRQLVSAPSNLKTGNSKSLLQYVKNFFASKNDLQALENYTETYTYDKGGNLTQIQNSVSSKPAINIIVAPDSNRAVQSNIGPTTNVDQYFDACGNQINSGSVNPLSWNYQNNISQAVLITRPSGNNDAEYYVYNGSRKRVRKVYEQFADAEQVKNITEVIYQGNVEYRRVLQGMDLETATVREDYYSLKINDESGKAATRSCWLIGSPPTSFASPLIFYHLSDHLKSATVTVDTTGAMVSIEEFSPYGNSTLFIGSDDANAMKNYRYSGKERDVTGFYYYGMRYYNTYSYRWLSTDPIGPADGLNLYEFVSCNPITFFDIGGMGKSDDEGKKKSAAPKNKTASRKRGREKSPAPAGGGSAGPADGDAGYEADDDKKRLRATKSAFREALEAGGVRTLGMAHQAEILVGKIDAPHPPRKMPTQELLVRHVSTGFLAMFPDGVEFQAAISLADKNIYISSNASERKVAKFLKAFPTLGEAHAAMMGIDSSGRVEGHISRLGEESEAGFGSYQLQQVRGPADEHAEIKLGDFLMRTKADFDFIAGTKRPCLSCSSYLDLIGVSQEKRTSHYGAYWDSYAAAMPFGAFSAEDITRVIAAKGVLVFNRNKDREGKDATLVNTDSAWSS